MHSNNHIHLGQSVKAAATVTIERQQAESSAGPYEWLKVEVRFMRDDYSTQEHSTCFFARTFKQIEITDKTKGEA